MQWISKSSNKTRKVIHQKQKKTFWICQQLVAQRWFDLAANQRMTLPCMHEQTLSHGITQSAVSDT